MTRATANTLPSPRLSAARPLRRWLAAAVLAASAAAAQAGLVVLQAPGSPTLWLIEDSAVDAATLGRLAGLAPGAQAESLVSADCPIVDGVLLAQRIAHSRRVIALVDLPARAALLPLLQEQGSVLQRDEQLAAAAGGADLPELLSLRAALRATAGTDQPLPAELRLVVARLAP
ncbi:MAG: hypothetical protein RL026_822 [Pseudomonadota bacterium]|jgi:hypothetical protein